MRKLVYVLKYIALKAYYRRAYKTFDVPRLAKGTNILIKNGGSLQINRNVTMLSGSKIICNKGNISIGDNCFFNYNCIMNSHQNILIESGCIFGPGVCIYDHNHKFDSIGVKTNIFSESSITIGANCWIGAGAIILKGSSIGEGCIIGAGTVVHGEIPPHSILKPVDAVVHRIENNYIH